MEASLKQKKDLITSCAFFRVTLFFLIIIGFFLMGTSVYIYFHIPLKKIYSTETNQFPISHYKKEFVFKVGQVSDPEKRANHFLNFPHEKKIGTIRIGAFGGSWTYGSEVKKGQSYPAQLMELFNKFPTTNKVEVLNFGVSGYGFPQSFLSWEEYSVKYKLDYILLGQIGFFESKRSTSFINPWYLLHTKYYLYPPKVRYIIKNNSKGNAYLQFINVQGKDFLTRYRNYYSLFPSWKILKYDKHYFNFWKQSVLPNSKKIDNPFYYSDLSEAEEATKIHKMLLNEMRKAHNKQILILKLRHENEHIYNMYKPVQEIYNFNQIDLFKKRTFLYRRKDHPSSLGNEVIASVYLNALKGKEKFSLKMFRCYKKIKKALYQRPSFKNKFMNYSSRSRNKIINKTSLSKPKGIKPEEIKKIELIYNDLKIGELQSLANKFNVSKGTKSLIVFFGSNDFFARGIAIPLPFQLYEHSQVSIQVKDKEKILLGYVFPIDKLGFVWGFQSKHIFTQPFPTYDSFPQYQSNRLIWKIQSKDNITPFFPIQPEQLIFNKVIKNKNLLSLWIQNYKVADLQPGRKNKTNEKNDLIWWFVDWLKPEESFVFIGPGHHIRHNDMPKILDKIFFRYITIENKMNLSVIPSWYCKKEKILFHLDLPNLNFL